MWFLCIEVAKMPALKKELLETRTTLNNKTERIESLSIEIQQAESRLRQSREGQEELVGQIQNAQALYEESCHLLKNYKRNIKKVNKK